LLENAESLTKSITLGLWDRQNADPKNEFLAAAWEPVLTEFDEWFESNCDIFLAALAREVGGLNVIDHPQHGRKRTVYIRVKNKIGTCFLFPIFAKLNSLPV